MLGAHQMMDDVRARSSTARVTEPLLTNVAHYDGGGVADSAVPAAMRSESLRRDVIVIVLLSELQIAYARGDSAELAVRNRLRFQLFKAIQLKMNKIVVVTDNRPGERDGDIKSMRHSFAELAIAKYTCREILPDFRDDQTARPASGWAG